MSLYNRLNSKTVLTSEKALIIDTLLKARKPHTNIPELAEQLIKTLLSAGSENYEIELWNKANRETIIEYIERVHGKRIAQREFAQADFKHLDFNGYQAFINYCSYRKIRPSTIIPTKTSLYPDDKENAHIAHSNPDPLQRRRAKERMYDRDSADADKGNESDR
jgi:hypothetical protein